MLTSNLKKNQKDNNPQNAIFFSLHMSANEMVELQHHESAIKDFNV